MGKRRTKEQKRKSLERRIKSNSFEQNQTKKERVVEFGYEQLLIRKDLKKTVVISLLILGTELALYFWLFK
jgi:hypothetical protein